LPSGNPGHGTRTSATIGGFYPQAAGTPYFGAAPGVKIIPYRVTDSVLIDHVKRFVALAIHDAIDKQCSVISISLGALFGDRKLSDALDAAYEHGVIVVCAAGNQWKEVIYPGRYNRCVTMGGVAPGMLPWAGSACGQYVDLCAPAQQVRRLKPEKLPPGQAATELYAPPDGNGTSYATALCAGVAALWLAWHGQDKLNAAYAQPWMKTAAFKHLLRSTALVPKAAQVPKGWDASQYGSGIVDAQALLAAELPLASSLHKALPAHDIFDPAD
jgi:subtilisin family serine protease